MTVASSPPRILALTHCSLDEPCTFARIFTPLQALHTNGLVDYALEPILPWRAATFQHLLRNVSQWDVVWAARPRHYLMLPLIKEARRAGVPVLVDIDDWLLQTPDSYNATQWAGTRTSQDTIRTALQAADAVTTSTQTIAARCAEIGVPAHVVSNAIDCGQFTRDAREQKAPITIGFCGTLAHRDDVSLITPALRQLLHSHAGRVRVVTAGCPIPDLESVAGYTHHNTVAATEYPRLLSELRLDIGLAPLHDTPFNQARSDIKFLEYSATGAATIASPVAEYSQSITEERGLVVTPNTPEAWTAVITRLIEDAPLRQRLADNAYAWVRDERSIEATADKWLALFREYAARRMTIPSAGRDPGHVGRLLEHVVMHQTIYYGREAPRLLLQRAIAGRR